MTTLKNKLASGILLGCLAFSSGCDPTISVLDKDLKCKHDDWGTITAKSTKNPDSWAKYDVNSRGVKQIYYKGFSREEALNALDICIAEFNK